MLGKLLADKSDRIEYEYLGTLTAKSEEIKNCNIHL